METTFFYIFTALFGLVAGSFLNALIYRLKTGDSIWRGRSMCPNCHKKLAWRDLIPLVSFFMLRRKCRYCKKNISWQYPLVEFSTAVLFLISLYSNFLNESGIFFIIRDWFFISVLIVIFVYDLKWGYILDRITMPAIIIAFGINILLGVYWLNMITAALIGGGFFFLQFIISKGRWVGGGDIRMGALMGFMLGWPGILVGLIFSYFIGALVSIYLLASKRKKIGSKIALGTFLAVGTIIALLFGNQILVWYLY